MQEIVFRSAKTDINPYTDVIMWIELRGPDFSRRVHGFWDGGDVFKVRFVATKTGEWTWISASNQNDAGLDGRSGRLEAIPWTEEEKQANPNRRGFIRATANGHAFDHADGSPFFMLGDTWLAASTWRLPYKGEAAVPDYEPGPGVGFEQAVAYRKRQGFNSISFIAAFPNWETDHYSATFADKNGVFVRNAWEKFGFRTAEGDLASKDMHDEQGRRPFELLAGGEGVADFERLNPGYFQSLDRKMRHLAEQGFVPVFETVRRDNCPTWKAYFDFNESYARFVQYLIARYGAFNMIFSGIHLDWIPEKYSLTADEFNAALTHHHHKFGPPPFGQPYTTLIDSSTYPRFGHGDKCPWLTMHSVGNNPRHHGVYALIEELFRLDPPYPAVNMEPYYTGWDHSLNMPAGERPPADSERDNYFARAQMYGSVLSGALVGHVHGTAAYDVTAAGEPAGFRPYIWDALRYSSGEYMRHLAAFVLSEGRRYQNLLLATDDIAPRQAPGSPEKGLDGWSFMMRTAGQDLALLYFEKRAVRATLSGFQPSTSYQWTFYDPRRGDWMAPIEIDADTNGLLTAPQFPGDNDVATTDWAAKLKPR
ncbi:MAG: DUF4038 domain-containing protein [Vicinamibacteria bacterium]|nr:DUF4038 domain-containing protein [Vicinamibacteria bacterium]